MGFGGTLVKKSLLVVACDVSHDGGAFDKQMWKGKHFIGNCVRNYQNQNHRGLD